MRTPRIILTTAAVAAGLGVVAAPAQAEERTCRGVLGAITIDNLRVPQDATATRRTSVRGCSGVLKKSQRAVAERGRPPAMRPDPRSGSPSRGPS